MKREDFILLGGPPDSGPGDALGIDLEDAPDTYRGPRVITVYCEKLPASDRDKLKKPKH
jgi:hypothetical protein